jgi:ElaB/YqjD/DUF883 family membrane-anchored ribosome-binding protein
MEEISIEEMQEKLKELVKMAEKLSKGKDDKSVQELIECCKRIGVLFREIKKIREIKIPA